MQVDEPIAMESEAKPKVSRRLPDGTYNSKPTDPDYFTKYYHEKNSLDVMCLSCGAHHNKSNMSRHMKSKKCQKASSHINDITATTPIS
jgi:hypothetical protein